MKHLDNLIPANEKGSKTDTVSTAKMPSRSEAMERYQACRNRLLDVNKWHSFAGWASAYFQLTDTTGHYKAGKITTGDFFKIDIPAPGTETGKGFDWVKVESIDENQNQDEDWEYLLIKVRPATNPTNADPDTAHFFSAAANSFFLVRREGNEISAEVHGRNEEPNTKTDKLKDKVRNAVVALGAMIGISKAQWKALTDGILSAKKSD